MSADGEGTGLGRGIRGISIALLLSVFVVPVLLWWQTREAGAARQPIQKVATSRFDLPALAPSEALETASAVPTPGAAPAAVRSPATATGDAGPAEGPGSGPNAARPAFGRLTPAPRAAGAPKSARPAPVRATAPPDPFVPEPAPPGWQNPAPQPTGSRIADLGFRNEVGRTTDDQRPTAGVGRTPVPNPKSEIRNPKSEVPGAARELPRSGAPRPAPVPAAQPLAAPAPAPPPTPLGDVRLRGIIRGTPDLALILVDGQTYFLKAGDTVTSTWVVGEINDNSVVLRSGDHVRELQIEGGSQS